MQLARLVDIVSHVRATTKKTEKTRLLADLLRQTRDRDTELAALYLTGSMPQGKIGIGWSVIRKALSESQPMGEAVTLVDVDQTVQELATEHGTGSTERKVRALGRLFA